MVQLMGHRQTKGPVTVRQHLNYRATSRLHSFHLKCSKQMISSQGREELPGVSLPPNGRHCSLAGEGRFQHTQGFAGESEVHRPGS